MFRSTGRGVCHWLANFVACTALIAAVVCANLPREARAIISSTSSININQFLGAERFYDAGYTGTRTIQANIEAGHIWNGHSTLGHVTTRVTGSGALGTDNSHATRVGAAMGGRPTSDTYPSNAQAWGIAYDATTWSGAVATSFTSDTEFNVTNNSVATTYFPILQSGVGGETANVFNSSWGFEDPDGNDLRTRGIDGLINNNGTVGVIAAGNSGSAANTVWSPGSGYNSITVGALTFNSGNYNSIASFSGRGLNDFAMATSPSNYTVISGVRAVVDIVAPGHTLRLATLNGSSNPNGYATGQAGTSFATPLVAGGASLIVDAGKDLYAGNTRAIDGRVVKAVLLNSADKIAGWDNMQSEVEGIIRTTQSLDRVSGAGRMNLDRAFDQYVSTAASGMAGTTDLADLGDGDVASVGWDFGWVDSLSSSTYFIDQPLEGGTNFTTTLSWFADRNAGSSGSFSGANERHLANLDLTIFQFDNLNDRNIIGTVAESVSLYNVVEHLSFLTPSTGYYGLRVDYTGAHWNFVGEMGEHFGLAWSTTPLVVEAGDRLWANPAGGSFATADNWSPAQTPGPEDNAVFDLSSSYTVQFADDTTNVQLRVGSDNVTFALNGHTYALTDALPAEHSIAVGSVAGHDGHLTLLGGTLTSVSAVLGAEVDSSGEVVVGADAFWDNSGDVFIALQGSANLSIQSGGGASSANASIGVDAGSLGVVTVDGDGSTWTVAHVRVGDQGDGELEVQNGGAVMSSDDSFIAHELESTGIASVSGEDSQWHNSASLYVGGSSTSGGGEGTLNIANGGTVAVADTLHVWSGGTVDFTGGTLTTQTLDVSEGAFFMTGGRLEAINVLGNLNVAGGTFAPGNSVDLASVTNDYAQLTDATLEIEVGGLTPGEEHDVVDVTGTASLAGTFAVALVDDFLPTLYDSFEVLLAAGGITGQFEQLMLPELDPSLAWNVHYNEFSVLLAVFLPGDYNGDGTVDAADYTVWRNNLGQEIMLLNEDQTQTPGVVTHEDYLVWKAHYGNTFTPGSGAGGLARFAAPVPEPGTTGILLVGLAAVWLRRSSRNPKIRHSS